MKLKLNPLGGLSPDDNVKRIQQIGGGSGLVQSVNNKLGRVSLSLADINDVTISSTPDDNQALSYDASTGKWIPKTVASGGAVDSVNAKTGVVVIDPDDLDDTSTTNKFVTASDVTKLSNLSGTNTGDQTLPEELTDLDTTVTGAQLNTLYANTSGTNTGDNPGLENIIEDTSPQLGGDLDTNGFNVGVNGNNGTLTITADTDGGEFNIGSDTSGTLAIYGSAGNTLNVNLLDGTLTIGAYTLPNTDGADGYVLTTDGSGNVAWESTGALLEADVDTDIKTLSLPASTTISTYGATLIDDTDASTARETLGLGGLATRDDISISNIISSTIVTELEGIANNDNDDTIPTSAAVKDYIDDNYPGDGHPHSGLYLTATDYITTPDDSTLDITGDIDVRVHLKPASWDTSDQRVLLKWDAGTNNRSYQLRLADSTARRISLFYSLNGSTSLNEESTADVPFSDGEAGWIRATRDSSSGDIDFYTSDDGESWTQLGTTITGSSGSLYSSNAALLVGSDSGGLVGVIYEAEIRNGIAGTIVSSPKLTVPSATRLMDAQGLVYTFGGSDWAWEIL